MIKINLLPKEGIKKKREFVFLSKIKFVIPVAVTFLVIAGLIAYIEITKAQLTQDIENQRKVLESLKIKNEEAKKFEVMNKEIETKTKLIEELKKRQNTPVMILGSIAKNLPDGVWLTELTYGLSKEKEKPKDKEAEKLVENKIVTKGFGFSTLNIVSFVEALKKSPEFTDVNLIETEQTEYMKVPVYKFVLDLRVKE